MGTISVRLATSCLSNAANEECSVTMGIRNMPWDEWIEVRLPLLLWLSSDPSTA